MLIDTAISKACDHDLEYEHFLHPLIIIATKDFIHIYICVWCILFDENKLISAEPFLVHKFIPKNI